jgi:hypothetical protein
MARYSCTLWATAGRFGKTSEFCNPRSLYRTDPCTPARKPLASVRNAIGQDKCASRPVSRVLYGPGPCGPERGGHSSGTGLAPGLLQPTRMTGPETALKGLPFRVIPIRFCSRWGLPCRFLLPGRAVGSYPTLSPLPSKEPGWQEGGLLSVALSLGSPPPDCYPAPCFHGARTFLTAAFRLSRVRPPGQLAGLP